MIRFLIPLALLVAVANLRADVTYDFTTSAGRQAFNSQGSTGTAWVQSGTDGWLLTGNSATSTGSAFISLINPVRFTTTSSSNVTISHFYNFANGVDGGRLGISTDGVNWNYVQGLTTNGYGAATTAWTGVGDTKSWTGAAGSSGAGNVINSVYQFSPVSTTTDYYFRLEARFAGLTDYGTDDIWGVRGMTIQNAAVPEPGTLLLGGFAAVSGGAGAWWRRRRKSKNAPKGPKGEGVTEA